MHELAPLIKDLTIILCLSGLVALLFRKIRQPVILGYLLAGVLVGPYTPPYILIKDLPSIQTLSELGVIFLMFALGLEFSFHKLKRVGFSASITGIWEVMGMLFLGLGVGLLLGWPFLDSLFLGAALSISSTTIIIKALDELQLKHRRFAEIIFGVLIVEDLLAILLLVGLSLIVTTSHIISIELTWAIIKLILVVGAWFLLGYFLVPSFFRRSTPYMNAETLTIISVGLCLFLVVVADYFHYSTALGAFIMGSILAETTLIHRIEPLILPLRNIFAAVFFVSVGMLIDPAVILEQWPIILILCLVTIVGKLLFTGAGAFLSGQDLTTSVRVGLGMAQIGEFSFIIIGTGLALGAISEQLYPIIVAVSAITTFCTPYLIKLSHRVSYTFDKYLPPRVHYFIDNYTGWVHRIITNPHQHPVYRRASIRFLVNAAIVAIIFLVIENVLLPPFIDLIKPLWLEKTLAWFIAILCSAPFIWGMLSAFQITPIEDTPHLFTNPGVQIGWIITVIELTSLSIAYFDKWWITLLFIFATIMFFLLIYKQLGKSYQWFEIQLIKNLHQRKFLESERTLIPKDADLIELHVSQKSPLVGTLIEPHNIRKLYEVNVVAIARGSKITLLSQSNHYILPSDRLIVLGDSESIEDFIKDLGLTRIE